MQQNFEKQLKRLLLSLALVNLVLFLSCGKEGRDVGGFTEDPHKLLSRVGLEGPTELVTGECAGYTVTLFNSFQVPVMAPTDLSVELSQQGQGEFYSGADCLGVIRSAMTLAKGESATTFYFQDRVSETVNLVTTIANVGIASLEVKIEPSAFLLLSDSPFFDFGSVYAGESLAQIITLTNMGINTASEISVSSLEEAFDYAGGNYPGLNGDCAIELEPQQSCSIEVSFSPQEVKDYSAVLSVTFTDGYELLNAERQLKGSGITAGLSDDVFGVEGKVISALGSDHDRIFDLVVLADGKIVAIGATANGLTSYDFALVRYEADGTIDTTFGENGVVTTDFQSSIDFALAAVQQADGKLVVAGYSWMGSNYDFSLARYDEAGLLDSSFGVNGRVTLDFFGENDYGWGVAITDDGDIVVAGEADNGTDVEMAMARLDPNGSIDTSFGVDGKVTVSAGASHSYGRAIGIQGDGKILVAGHAFNGADTDFAVIRLLGNGNLDSGFGQNGTRLIDFVSGNDEAYVLAIQPDGKIVVGGGAIDSSTDFGLMRLTATGNLDTAFGNNGTTLTSFGQRTARIRDIAIDEDGHILAAGAAFNGANDDFALARYDEDGGIDLQFGVQGKTVATMGASTDRANAILIQDDGKIILAGDSYQLGNYDFALTRFWP